MASLKALLRDLNRALEANKEGDATAVRRAIADAFPDTPEGAEASYKLGLARLFREQDLDGAAEAFRAAAKAKQPRWSLVARVSLGTVLLRQGKLQQGLFELRRAASAKPASLLTAQAAGLLLAAVRESGGQDTAKVRDQYHAQLDALIRGGDAETVALAHLWRGMEHKLDGEPKPAEAHLRAALASEALPAAERASAERALAAL